MAGLFLCAWHFLGDYLDSILECLPAGSGKSPLSSRCFAIRRGPCRCSACQRHNTAPASATCKPLSNRDLGIFRVGIFTTLKMPKAVIISNLRAAPFTTGFRRRVSVSAVTY